MKKKLLFPFVFVLCLVAAGVFYTSHQSSPYDQPIDQQLWDNALTAFDNKQYDQVLVLASSADHPRFQTLEGLIWEHGLGVAKNPAKAFALYQEAARSGDPEAMNKISRFYSEGIAVKQDPKQAWKWTQKAAEKKDGGALIDLGLFFLYESETPQDALKYFVQAADEGDLNGIFLIAFIMDEKEYKSLHKPLKVQFLLDIADIAYKQKSDLLRDLYPHLFFPKYKESVLNDKEVLSLREKSRQRLSLKQKEKIKSLAGNWRPGMPIQVFFQKIDQTY